MLCCVCEACTQLHTLFYYWKLHLLSKSIKFYLHAHVDLANLITKFIFPMLPSLLYFWNLKSAKRKWTYEVENKNATNQTVWHKIELTSSCSRWNFSFFRRASWTLSWINEKERKRAKNAHKIKQIINIYIHLHDGESEKAKISHKTKIHWIFWVKENLRFSWKIFMLNSKRNGEFNHE